MPEETQVPTNTPTETDSGDKAEDILYPEHSKKDSRPGGQEEKAAEQDANVKTDKEKAAEQRMHQATEEAAKYRKLIEEGGFSIDGDKLVPPQQGIPAQETGDEKKTLEEKFYDDPLGATTQIVSTLQQHQNLVNTFNGQIQARDDFELIKDKIPEIEKEYQEFMPTEKEIVSNPQGSLKKAEKVYNMILTSAIARVTPEAIAEAERNGKAKAENEQEQRNLVGGISTGGKRKEEEKETTPEEDIRQGIINAGRVKGKSFF